VKAKITEVDDDALEEAKWSNKNKTPNSIFYVLFSYG